MKMPVTPEASDEQIGTYFTLARPLAKLKRLLTTIQQAANSVSPEVSERVQSLILHLVNNCVTPEQFQTDVQTLISCPLKQFVVPFIVSTLPLLQEEIYKCNSSSPQQIKTETVEEAPSIDISSVIDVSSLTPLPTSPPLPGTKRPLSTPPEAHPSSKRVPTPDNHIRVDNSRVERSIHLAQCLGGVARELEKELSSIYRVKRGEEEVISGMSTLTSFLNCLAEENAPLILAQVKDIVAVASQCSLEKAITLVNKQNSSKSNCWNCGRKAYESCSGCKRARYCGQFCQHKDWENHHAQCESSATEAVSETLVVDEVREVEVDVNN